MREKGIALVVIILGIVAITGIGYVGVRSGLLKLTAAPSNPGSPVSIFDRLKKSPTPTPEPGWKFDNLESAGDEITDTTGAVEGAVNMVSYTSSEYGYSLMHPAGWSVVNVPAEDHREIKVQHPDGVAFVLIAAHKEPAIGETMSLDQAVQIRLDSVLNNPNFTITSSDKSVQGDVGGYMAVGEETFNGEKVVFEERGIFGSTGKIIIFHGAVLSKYESVYADAITQTMESFSLQ